MLEEAEMSQVVNGVTSSSKRPYRKGHCCKVSDEAAFCLIQRP
ncbi:RepB family protein, partial [Klebsiella pneumoniae]